MDVPTFTNADLKKLIIPLFLEQLLFAFVGIADVFVAGFVGESAISGVSLINSFNTIFLNLFVALATGGAVVISQYIGRKDREQAAASASREQAAASASRLLTASVLMSVVVAILVSIFNRPLMGLMFGKVEGSVMDACVTHLCISAYSYPMLAICNAGAAFYRSFGKTSTTLYISIVSNIVNVVGNCIGVFLLHAGVEGVAWPSPISCTLSAVLVTVFCFSENNPVQHVRSRIFKHDGKSRRRPCALPFRMASRAASSSS